MCAAPCNRAAMGIVSSGIVTTLLLSLRRLVFASLLLAFSLLGAQAGPLADFFLGPRDVEVITNTEVTPAGRKLPAPSPTAPQYYLAISGGYQDLGGIIAGITAPPPSDVLKMLTAELAKRGYLPATEKTPPPTLALFFIWGTLNTDQDNGGDIDAAPGVRNRAKILRFLGGEKAGLGDSFFDPLTAPAAGLSVMSADSRDLYEAASEDFYVTVVSAYDFESVRQHKRELLWMTRIATFGRGFDLPEVLPAMIAIGGAQFGRETPKPVWLRASDKFKVDVRIGELQLVEYLQGAKIPVIDGTASPKQTDKAQSAPAPKK